MYLNDRARPHASQRKIQWTFRTDLRRLDRDVCEALDTTPSKYAECLRSAKWIARQIGASVSAVRGALQRLAIGGVIAVRRDYTLITKRAIQLLWRTPEPTPQPEPEVETMSHAAAEPASPTRVPPCEDAPRVQDEAPTQGRKATSEEVQALVRQATALDSRATPHAVKDAARLYGVGLLRKAVEHAKAKGKGRFGWALAVARSWATEGVPEYAEDAEDFGERVRREAMELFGPNGSMPWKPEPSPFSAAVIPIRVQDDRPAHLAWANSPNPFLRKLAAEALGRGR